METKVLAGIIYHFKSLTTHIIGAIPIVRVFKPNPIRQREQSHQDAMALKLQRNCVNPDNLREFFSIRAAAIG